MWVHMEKIHEERNWKSLFLKYEIYADRIRIQSILPFYHFDISYDNIEKTEIPHPVGPFDTARYSLIKAFPESGRRHQIRRHLRHVSYPIAGDRLYGDRDHNRFFRETLDLHEMFLHATEISFTHPLEKKKLTLHAPLPDHWIKAFSLLGFSGMTIQNEVDRLSGTPEP